MSFTGLYSVEHYIIRYLTMINRYQNNLTEQKCFMGSFGNTSRRKS